MTQDTLAARLRAALVGDYTGDVMPFDELKPEIQERWQRVADAAKLRVPMDIEAMAKAGFAAWYVGDGAELPEQSAPVRARWAGIIRAALAAGGLEPCAPPEYDPADVALRPEKLDLGWLSIRDNGRFITIIDNTKTMGAIGTLLPADAARMAAWLSSYAAAHGAPDSDLRAMLTDTERKIHNQRAELKRLNTLVADLRTQLAGEMEWTKQYKQDRDDALAELADLRERDRLAAENAELREERDAAVEFAHAAEREFCAANATLDALREVVPEVLPPHMSWMDALDGARAILYPKETDNAN